ncbi:MAG: site-specific DNA-methyltransferase [Desulfatiglandales bacterium]
MRTLNLICGDALEELRKMDSESVQCCVTSPPYWGLRDYGIEGQLGLEKTPEEYTARMVEVFREVRRVLRDDGTLWLNLGDSYAAQTGPGFNGNKRMDSQNLNASKGIVTGLRPKNLVGIPWRIAFALQADGWYLRSDIIWAKPNPMPESVADRPTKAHEYLFLLSKSPHYYYDFEAIKEPVSHSQVGRIRTDQVGGKSWAERGQHSEGGRYEKAKALPDGQANIRTARDNFRRYGSKRAEVHPGQSVGTHRPDRPESSCAMDSRNKRSVWIVATKPYPEAHFATFPPGLIQPCILAGCPKGGTVLDPFAGSGTAGIVAINEGRNFVGIELNPEYIEMAEARIKRETAQQRIFV